MDKLSIIRQPIEAELERFGQLFDQTMNEADGLLGRICQSIAERKGKLMRPILLMLVAREWGAVSMAAYRAALTLELLHNASLVHDDIVDESDMRRGRPSVRSIYGNKTAVLAGDYLLSSALDSAALSGDIKIVNNVSLLGKRLSEGELLQLFNTQNTDFSEEKYYHIIRLKTASLFSAATRIGAISSGADDDAVSQMDRLGDIIGLCFQIRDDIFDYYDNDTGKPSGNDMLEGKLTLPVLYTLNSTNDEALLAIAAKVRAGTATADEIATLVRATKTLGGISYANDQMERLSLEAKALIANFRNPEIKQALSLYIDFVSERTN
ncbi:MAG: polyprenyl synthetase family protein [Bacteroidaceae bacterium]|nr:polyprenyl synthetase family protein [Bacteroidaceae bacterium]MBR3634226.1 polyprenyl synthetase family protein [Bacteroidaceae bacterium]MBR3733320.1 polyprenyl synthetase family protein [Bacteroidaceae bacterium]MBR6713951.1 polyprenyl synthetase family protein [Bacteroidaceae bacterium]